jgi:microsomal dipeptidase-like Zn-dependent dipeptidase
MGRRVSVRRMPSAKPPPFVVDLHAHFPMQFDPEAKSYRRRFHQRLRQHPRLQEKLGDKIRFWGLEIADRFMNRERPCDGHAVTLETLARGHVGVALSVAYNPVDELEIEPYPAPPKSDYFRKLEDLLQRVEDAVHQDRRKRARFVKDADELRAALRDGKVAMIHAVEGGFHVGLEEAIRANTRRLAERGVGYVTVAHLFWRLVATNVAAIPFLPDALYHELFPQDPNVGLDERGKVLVREMVRHGILIDVTHMSKRGMGETFELLDRVDPDGTVPVIASHVACSFGGYEYNLEREWVERIARRRGVCGIIYCDHYTRDGRGSRTRTFSKSFDVIRSQIDKLREWGGDDVLAIGSDLDGFIKPTLAGLSSARQHARLARRLVREYGEPLAGKICHENAMRVFQGAWMKAFAWPDGG